MRFILLLVVVLTTMSTYSYGDEAPAQPQHLPEVLALLNDNDETIRMQAAELLGQCCVGADLSPEIIPALIHALSDPKWRVKRNAIISLGQIGSKDAVFDLIKCLRDENWVIRSKAVHALGEIGSPEAADAIIKIMKDEDESVRKEAIIALGKMRAEKAIPLLLNALTYSEEDEGMELATLSLIRIGTPSTIPLLRLLGHKNPQVRQQAAYSLGEIQDMRAISPLVEALSTEDELPRRDISAALVKMGTTAIPALLPCLNTNDMDLKGCLVWILGEIGDNQATPSLLMILNIEEDQSILKKTVWALGKIGDEKALPILISWLKNDHGLGESVIIALGRINDEKAVRMFVAALQNDAANLPWQEIGDEGIDLLIVAAQDTDAGIRRCAAAALGKTYNKRAVAPLIAMLNDDDWRSQRNAVIGLGDVGATLCGCPSVGATLCGCPSVSGSVSLSGETILTAVPHLINLLDSTNTLWTVRGNAAIAMGKIRDASAIPVLIKSLKDEDSFVRACAAEALGKLQAGAPLAAGAPSLQPTAYSLIQAAPLANATPSLVTEVIAALIERLDDPDASVQEASVSALINIGSSCIPALLESVDRTTPKPKPSTLIHAFTIFGKLHAAETVDILIDNLSIEGTTSSKHKKICGKAAWALGEIGDKRAIEPLIEKLRNGIPLATDVLTPSGIPQPFPSPDGTAAKQQNIPLLGGDISEAEGVGIPSSEGSGTGSQPQILPQVIEAIGKLKGEEAIPYLVRFLQAEGDTEAAKEIASITTSALVNIGTPCVPSLIEVLSQKNDTARANATLALGQLRDKRAVPALTAMIKDEAWYVRAAAVIALGEIADNSALEPLAATAMEDENEDVRVYASNALGKIDDDEVIKFLMISLDDSNADIQLNAALALGERGYLEGIHLLIEHLNAKDPSIRKIVINRLTLIGKPVIPLLIEAMGHKSNTIRKVATDVLTTMGDDAIVPILQVLQPQVGSPTDCESLDSNNDQKIVRWYAAIALGSLLEKTQDAELQEKIIASLSHSLNDDSWYGRGGAAIALGNISANNQDALVEALLKGLNDTNGVVRITTAEALGKIAAPRALKMLTILSNNDPEKCVRAAAKAAIARIQKQMEE